MGLTIHYNLRFKGSSEEIKRILSTLIQVAHQLSLKYVGQIYELDYSKDWNDDFENKRIASEMSESYRWAKIQYQPRCMIMKEEKGQVHRPNEQHNEFRGYVVILQTGAGCEPTNIGLISRDNTNWAGSAFTKTQYAEDFVKCHLLVCSILDICKKLGILERVEDEGDYYKTRNLKKLAKNINKSTAFISSIMGNLKKIIKDNFGEDVTKIEAPIKKCKNYMNVKSKQEAKVETIQKERKHAKAPTKRF